MLTLNKTCALVCGASLINELVRGMRIKKTSSNKLEEYDDYSNNYYSLMKIYTNNVPFTNILKYLFGVNVSKDMVSWQKHYFRDDLNNNYFQGVYYE